MRSWRDLVLITSHRVGSAAPDPVDVPAAIRFTARIIRRAGRNGQVESAPQQLARVLVPRQQWSRRAIRRGAACLLPMVMRWGPTGRRQAPLRVRSEE